MSDTNIELITQARTEKNEVLPYELLERALINRWLLELGAHCLAAPAYQLPHHLGAGEKRRLLVPTPCLQNQDHRVCKVCRERPASYRLGSTGVWSRASQQVRQGRWQVGMRNRCALPAAFSASGQPEAGEAEPHPVASPRAASHSPLYSRGVSPK